MPGCCDGQEERCRLSTLEGFVCFESLRVHHVELLVRSFLQIFEPGSMGDVSLYAVFSHGNCVCVCVCVCIGLTENIHVDIRTLQRPSGNPSSSIFPSATGSLASAHVRVGRRQGSHGNRQNPRPLRSPPSRQPAPRDTYPLLYPCRVLRIRHLKHGLFFCSSSKARGV